MYYLVNHLPEWNESGELLSLEILDEFFLLRRSIYQDIITHHLKLQAQKEPKKVILLKLRNHYRHINSDNIIGDLTQRFHRSHGRKAL